MLCCWRKNKQKGHVFCCAVVVRVLLIIVMQDDKRPSWTFQMQVFPMAVWSNLSLICDSWMNLNSFRLRLFCSLLDAINNSNKFCLLQCSEQLCLPTETFAAGSLFFAYCTAFALRMFSNNVYPTYAFSQVVNYSSVEIAGNVVFRYYGNFNLLCRCTSSSSH